MFPFYRWENWDIKRWVVYSRSPDQWTAELELGCRCLSMVPCCSFCQDVRLLLPPGRLSRLLLTHQIPPSFRDLSHCYLLCGDKRTPHLWMLTINQIFYFASCKSQFFPLYFFFFFLQIRNPRFRKFKSQVQQAESGSRIYDFWFCALPLGSLPVHDSWSCPYA